MNLDGSIATTWAPLLAASTDAGVAERIPLPKGSTDVVCAVNAIHHWTDLEGSIEEISSF